MEMGASAVRRQLGLHNTQDNHAIERVIAIELAAAKGMMEEKLVSKDAPLKESQGDLIIFDGLKVTSKSLASHLKGCTKATFFAVTIGGSIDREMKERLDNDETPQAMVLDAIGSVACETLAERADAEISERAKKAGYGTTRRFSPGYGDWKIESQKEILAFLEAQKIGISLTGSCLMLPRKSITAVKGWYYPK